MTPFKGYEFVEADNIAEAKKIAEKHAKESGWGIGHIREVENK